MGYSEAHHFGALSFRTVVGLGGTGLLRRFGYSLLGALQDCFGMEAITAEHMRSLPQGAWDEMERRRAFLDEVAEAHGVRTAADWQRVPAKAVVEQGGSGLLNRYSSSLAAALADVYGRDASEEEVRQLQQRQRLPRSHWEDEENVCRFVAVVERELGLAEADHWYRVTREQVEALAGGWSLLRCVGLPRALRIAYPRHRWDDARLARPFKRAQQFAVRRML
eukprot:CAMPEP_0114634172 /NCGR_PEP_ID=MMETSP0168-20121206/15836_1 /TAXON_ID=95228 ORGANISM="Vannella sp., Strain DIVA3 517/6/12" /NCGR_SAMPLE_ID=MMETSP0168 /ASSEMBLY_ACC=CAM_ASM_000044 /LENGTH=221 /DNA_ID=CAMNT_0001845851 /DNA_START=154 /DNA_END=816 /DNA_ORIENTATION=+